MTVDAASMVARLRVFLKITVSKKEAVSHQNISERRSAPQLLHGSVMQMQCPCVSFDDRTHPDLSNSSSPIRSCKTPTHVSSTLNTPPITSSCTRFCALTRASGMLPAFKRVAMSRRVIWLWKCLCSCNWARRRDVAFKRVCMCQGECIAVVNVSANLERGRVPLMVCHGC